VLLRYAAWLALSAVGLWACLQARLNVLDLLIFFRVSHWSLPALEKAASVLLILLWLVGALGLEPYLTSAQETSVFLRRASRVAVIEVGALALSYVLQWLL
jgi:hypothetical protein